MKNYKLVNTYKNCKSPDILSEVEVNYLFEEIGSGNYYGDTIDYLRKNLNSKEIYKSIKESQLPTYTLNATFHNRRSKDNYVSSTGLLYVDIDGTTDLHMNNEIIYASYKSVSGKGRSVIVKVEGITPNNIKPVYKAVNELLEVSEENRDYSCGDITRQTIMTYDPDIYINENCRILDVEELEIKVTPPIKDNIQQGVEIFTFNGGFDITKIYYDNTYLVDLQGQDFKFFPDKIALSKVFVPSIINKGNRYNTLMSLMTNLVGINPEMDQPLAYSFLLKANDRCIEPLQKNELDKIIRDVYKRLESGNLNLIKNMPRSIIVDTSLSKEKKQKYYGIASGLVRSNKSRNKIADCLDNWDLLNEGKVTNKKIANKTSLNIKTVEKYSKEFKEQKTLINKNIGDRESNSS